MSNASCDKCHEPAVGEPVPCDDCSKVYRRCAKHGGEKGARRSLHSHKALFGKRHWADDSYPPGEKPPPLPPSRRSQ